MSENLKWCAHCSKIFKTRNHRDRHINDVHTRETTYQCGQCSYRATQKGNVKTHMKIHNKRHPTSATIDAGQLPPATEDSANSIPSLIVQTVPAHPGWSTGRVGNASNTYLSGAAPHVHRAPPAIFPPTSFVDSVDEAPTIYQPLFGHGYPIYNSSQMPQYPGAPYPLTAAAVIGSGCGGSPVGGFADGFLRHYPHYPGSGDINAQASFAYTEFLPPVSQPNPSAPLRDSFQYPTGESGLGRGTWIPDSMQSGEVDNQTGPMIP